MTGRAATALRHTTRLTHPAVVPELPEVADALRRLRPHLLQRTLRRLEPRHPSVARHLPPAACRRAAGRTVVRLERRGKYQLLHLDDGALLLAHFRMTGDWEPLAPADPLPPHARLLLHCDDGTRIALVDPRVLGTVTYHAPGEPPVLPLGPEPLTRAFTPARLAAQLTGKRGPLKPVLLDQRVVAGLGNIYAAEACWHAGLDPRRPAGTLSPDEIAALTAAIKAVLRAAPRGRYWERSGDPPWQVYDREGAACRRCDGTVARFTQAGRSTYWCPGCQRAPTPRGRRP
jgi:formamidopyrimidine-DNA glycosylase